MPSLACTVMDQTKYRFSLMFAFVCIFGTVLNVFTCKSMGWPNSDNKIIRNKKVYHTDEMPLDIVFNLNGLLPMHYVY